MKSTVRHAPPNSMFFIEDRAGGESPDIDDRPVKIWATASCVIVACLSFVDGETELTVSAEARDAPSTAPAFDGLIDSPSRLLEVSTSEREVLLSAEVATGSTRIRVWTNRPSEPDKIFILLDA